MTRRDVPPCHSGIERDEDDEIKRHKLVVSKKKATTLAGFRMGKRLRNGVRTRRKASWLMQGVFQRGNKANRNDLREGHPNGELPCSCAGWVRQRTRVGTPRSYFQLGLDQSHTAR